MPPSDPPRGLIDALEKRVLPAEIELDAGKIRLEIALHRSDGLGHLRRGRAGRCAGRPVEQYAFRCFRTSCRQLEARDAHAVPGDAAKAVRCFKDKVLV